MKFDSEIDGCSKLLNDLSEDYKVILVKKCAEERGGVKNIDCETIINVDRRLKDRIARSSPWGASYVNVAFICCLLSIMSLIGLLFVKFDVSLISGDSRFLMTCFLTSYSVFFVLYLAFYLLRIKQKIFNDKSLFYLEYEIVSTWREFESRCREINVLSKFGENVSSITIMKKSALFNKADVQKMRSVLRMRNEIVHSNGRIYQESAIRKNLDFLKYVLKVLDENI